MKHIAFVAIFSTILLGACGAEPENEAAPSGDGGSVVVKDFAFAPASLEVDAGTTVVWASEDTVLHTVTSGDFSGAENEADGTFDGKLPKSGSTFEHRFEEQGTFTYFCSQHNVMNGTVTVR